MSIPSEYSEGMYSEDYSHYSDYDGTELSARSTLAELLERFTIDAKPDCTLKLRSTAGPVVVGVDLTRVTAARTNVGALVLKPSNADQPWRRLRIDNSGTLTLRSRKLSWWLFTLDVIGHANPFTRTLDLSYRVATKWDVARGEYRNKKRLELTPKTEARAHWSISYCLPAIEGSMGTAAQQMSREMHADVGYAHLDIPRLELVVWPRGKPASAASADEAGLDDLEAGEESAALEVGGGNGSASSWHGSSGSSIAAAGVGPELSVEEGGDSYGAAGGAGGGMDGAAYSRGGSSSAGSAAGSRGAGHQKASLQELNSHVASISGRWWETYGSSSSSRDRQRQW